MPLALPEFAQPMATGKLLHPRELFAAKTILELEFQGSKRLGDIKNSYEKSTKRFLWLLSLKIFYAVSILYLWQR